MYCTISAHNARLLPSTHIHTNIQYTNIYSEHKVRQWRIRGAISRFVGGVGINKECFEMTFFECVAFCRVLRSQDNIVNERGTSSNKLGVFLVPRR